MRAHQQGCQVGQLPLQVLESWEAATWAPAVLPVERAMLSACQDALSETRAIARSMFGAFAAALPHRVGGLLGQLHAGQQARMRQAIAAYEQPGATLLSQTI